jgi:protein TonB
VGAPRERVLAPLELPEPRAARDWEEFRRNAGQRLVAAHPGRAYLGAPPEVLFGIPVIETELYVDGTIRSIKVLRVPADARARDTVDLAVAAVRRAAPYGDMSRLSRPWKWVEVFLFNDKRQFKPRSLD